MQAITLESAHADLRLAKKMFYQDLRGETDYYMLNLIAYHSAQVIEKLIKNIILEKCPSDVYRDLYDKHNFETFIKELKTYYPEFLDTHDYIVYNADELSKFNNLRYGKQCIFVEDVHELLQETKAFFKEMNKEYLKDYPDFKKNQEFAARALKENGPPIHLKSKEEIARLKAEEAAAAKAEEKQAEAENSTPEKDKKSKTNPGKEER